MRFYPPFSIPLRVKTVTFEVSTAPLYTPIKATMVAQVVPEARREDSAMGLLAPNPGKGLRPLHPHIYSSFLTTA